MIKNISLFLYLLFWAFNAHSAIVVDQSNVGAATNTQNSSVEFAWEQSMTACDVIEHLHEKFD